MVSSIFVGHVQRNWVLDGLGWSSSSEQWDDDPVCSSCFFFSCFCLTRLMASRDVFFSLRNSKSQLEMFHFNSFQVFQQQAGEQKKQRLVLLKSMSAEGSKIGGRDPWWSLGCLGRLGAWVFNGL